MHSPLVQIASLALILTTLAAPALEETETMLTAADQIWSGGDPAAAADGYRALLERLPEAADPLFPLVVMRLARALQAAGDVEAALAALDRLQGLAYVPEHHALGADELREVLAGRPHPGLQRTPIPALAADARRIVIGPDRDAADLPAALAAARRLRAARPEQAIHILFAPGEHRMAAAAVLSAEDSGRDGAPLVIGSLDPSQPATILGSTRLTGWQPVRDPAIRERLPEGARDQVRVCDLGALGVDLGPIILGGGHSSVRAQLPDKTGVGHGRVSTFLSFPVPELFLDGVPQPLAAWPDYGAMTRLVPTQAPADEAELARRLRWRGEPDLWLHGYWVVDWSDAWEIVADVREDGVIELVPPHRPAARVRSGGQGRVVNALVELDQPGEWKIDGPANRIIWWPPEGTDPEAAELSTAVGFLQAQGVHHLQIRNLHLRNLRGDALVLTDCDDAVVAGLDIRNASGMGLRHERGRRLLVHSCTITSMGRGGMDILTGDWATLDRGDAIIENCRISDLSRIDRTYTPAAVLEGYGLVLRYSHFERIPSSAIRVESGATRIELTVFRDCVRESGDQGAIDVWANPLLRGNIIRWNDFHRITSKGSYGAAAVRHDDWISGFMTYENVFRTGSRGGFGAIQTNQGNFNWNEGNLHLDGHALLSGRAGRVNQRHPRAGWVMQHADWRSAAWTAAHPMVARLLDGGPNYAVDNLSNRGRFGHQRGAVLFANRAVDLPLPEGENLAALAAHMPPWRQIPVATIGTYTVSFRLIPGNQP